MGRQNMTEVISTRALYEEVADRIRHRIYQQELLPGDFIDERLLCETFGISRTPMREALKVLANEGLVELIPRRGSFVKRLDLDELRELFPVMAALEGLCVRETARNLTDAQLAELEAMHARLEDAAAAGDIDAYYEQNFAFHQALQDYSANRWLQRITSDLRRILRLARHHQLTNPGRLRGSLEEHRRIMEGLRARDVDQVDKQMQEHLQAQCSALEQYADRQEAQPAAQHDQITQEQQEG